MEGVVTWANRVLLAVLLAVVAWHFALRVQLIADHRVDLGGAEINVVYGAQKILLGRPLYEDPEQPPFDVMQYTPAYYAMLAGLAEILGVPAADTYGLFRINRIMALVMNLLTSALVYALCRAVGVTRWIAIAVALFALVLFTEHSFGRGDALYALLFAAALLVHASGLEQHRHRALLFTALLSVLCVLAKQTGLLVIGIIAFDLLLRRAWREAWIFAVAVAALGSIAALAIATSASGPYFLKNTVQGLANGISPSMYREFRDLATCKYYAPFHAALLVLVARAIAFGGRTDRFLASAGGLSLAFGLLAGLKSGSNLNYLFEAHLLASVLVARSWRGTSRWPHIAMLLFMILFARHRSVLLQRRTDVAEVERHAAAYRADLAVHRALLNELGLKPAEKVLVTYRGHLELLLNGQGLVAQKDVVSWSVRDVYDLSAFIRMMDEGEVRYVIGESPRDTLRFRGHEWFPVRSVLEVEGRYVLQLPAVAP